MVQRTESTKPTRSVSPTAPPSNILSVKATRLLIACLAATLGPIFADESKPPSSQFDLSHWKLTLPEGGDGSPGDKALEVQAGELSAGYTHPKYFYSNSEGAMVFWCPADGAKTENTDYPRTELREVIDPSDDNVCWKAPGTHVLDVRCRVSEVPSTQKVIIGQIHGFSGKAVPMIKLQFFKGRVEALIKEKATGGKDRKLTFPEVGLDKDFDFQIKLSDGALSVTVNGETQTEDIFGLDPEWAKQTLYFKVGSYVQDNEGPSTEGGRVAVSKLSVSHQE